MVAITPAGASAILGASRRSMISTGRCHSRSTTFGPASRSNSLAKRGPMPARLVTSAKSGLRMSGRKGSLEFQQLLDIAGEDLDLVLLAKRDVRNPLDRRLVL